MRRLLLSCVLLLSLLLPSTAFAWSYKEHVLVTRLAVQRLLADPQTPESLKAWLQEAAPNAGDAEAARNFLIKGYLGPNPDSLEKLDYWAIFPDVARQVDGDTPVRPFGVSEAPMHFIDLELLLPGDEPKVYKHDLSNKPSLADLPRDFRDPRLVQAGYLPWRVDQIYNDLVAAIRQDRLMPKDDQDRDNALVLAGYLAHYLADNTQPQHSTIDYKSASYFDDARSAPNVHGMFEYGMVDWDDKPFPDLREMLWSRMQQQIDGIGADPAAARWLHATDQSPIDPWTSTAEIALDSYDYLPAIGTAAQKAAKAGPTGEFDVETFFASPLEQREDGPMLLDLKARQLALASLRIEALLRQAWQDANEPAATKPSGQ